MGLEGLLHLRQFIDAGGAFIASNSSADFAHQQQLHLRRHVQSPGNGNRAWSARCCASKLADETSPVVYGVPDNLAVYSDAGETFSVSATAGGGGRGGGGGGGGARRRRSRRRAGGRPTGRGTPDDPDVVQGRPADEGTNLTAACRTPQQVQPWQYAIPTEEALKRNPANVIPPKFRPRVPLRYDAQSFAARVRPARRRRRHRAARRSSSTSRSARGTSCCSRPIRSIAARRVGSYFMVFNTILNFDSLDAGRKLDPR